MIPKKIHYCWFGGKAKPVLARRCIKSWNKYCHDYEIIEWNEDNFDISSCPLYVRQAYEAKMWAFVTDYVRLKVVFDYGGIYLDTDVEVIKEFNNLLNEKAFFGFEYGKYIATGLGFGAEKGNNILYDMMCDYDEISFVKGDGSFDLTPCPVRNSEILIKYGLKLDDSKQRVCGCLILPSEYLCPYDGRAKKLKLTENSISIHWYNSSWVPKEQRKTKDYYQWKARRQDIVHALTHIPNHLLRRILGEDTYEKIKDLLKK